MIRWLGLSMVWLTMALGHFWAFGAIYFCSFPNNKTFKLLIGIVYLCFVLFVFFRTKQKRRAYLYSFACFGFIFLWFFSIKPNPDAVYPEHLRAPYAEFNGDRVTLHNIR